MRMRTLLCCAICIKALDAMPAPAIEVKISAQALERTLKAQLFSGAEGRYYMRGSATSACYVYAEQPKVTFKDDRVWVHVRTHARLGTGLRSACLGVSLTTEADVSFVPEAEGESVGFRDARIERASESRELNFLLVPFLSHKLPTQMKVDAAQTMSKLLSQSVASTGYALSLNSLKLHSMTVDHGALIVDVDAGLSLD
ncbi:MAG TPA: hypothetical protein VN612_10150 [Acidobacteriaceae bacterium]|nr:hypothetical protein [Acidobacteriaceae bacterium]